MAVSARDVAAALRERLPGLSKTKEQKLLYYCQGHHLAAFNEPMFREAVSAWDYGPVVGEYYKETESGARPGSANALDQAMLNTVGYVVSRYGRLTAKDLVRLTHAEDPWQIANKDRRPKESVRIQHDWMRDYFRENPIDDDEVLLDSAEVTKWLRDAAEQRQSRGTPRENTVDQIVARLARA